MLYRILIPLLALSLNACNHNTRPSTPPSSLPDAAWLGQDKTYAPPPVDQVLMQGFGIDKEVDVLGNGVLPITITREVVNSGTAPLAAGYPVTETVQLMVFVSVPGGAGWAPSPDASHTLFTCNQPGPPLQPGESAVMVFSFPGLFCTPNPTLAFLPLGPLVCGMYKETLVVDDGNTVLEGGGGELNNETEHYFFVPSSAPRLNMAVALNPNNDANLNVVPVQRVMVPAFNYPGPGQVTVTTHRVTVTTVPAGGAFVMHGRSLVNGSPDFAPDVANLVPPITPPLSVPAGPFTIDYDITFDPAFLGPDITGSGLYYAEGFDNKVTAISADGCQIRQKVLKATVLHEERP